MKKRVGLRRRWFLNTVGVVCTLGLACVLAATAVFAYFQYSNLEAALRYSAQSTVDALDKLPMGDADQLGNYFKNISAFARGNEQQHQLLSPDGTILVSSCEGKADCDFTASDVEEAISNRGSGAFLGEDPLLGYRVMAVSEAVINESGELIAIIRFLSPMNRVDTQILLVALFAVLVLVLITAVVLITSNYYIQSILTPVAEITEKTRRIAGGTYGIQITSRYDDEIGELVRSINDMSAQIAQNEKTQSEFISSLSHELRTPLTAITGWSETLLSEDSLNQEQQRGMKIILGEARRLTEMVVDLLDFTRIQGGKMTLNMELTDIRGEFEDTVFMYGSRLAQDGIQLRYIENEDDIPEVSCDAKRLRQVFLNILDNAAKHGGDGKTIDASIHYSDEQVIVRIRDYGPGIPEDEIPLVKKKFYKGSSKARGSGIGLAVSDEIIEMHGGQLVLENAPGNGTLVTVTLPAVQ